MIIELCGKQKMPAVLYRLCSYNISLFAAAAENNLRRYIQFFDWFTPLHGVSTRVNNVYINIKVAVLYSATGSPFYKDKENAVYYYRPREMYKLYEPIHRAQQQQPHSKQREREFLVKSPLSIRNSRRSSLYSPRMSIGSLI